MCVCVYVLCARACVRACVCVCASIAPMLVSSLPATAYVPNIFLLQPVCASCVPGCYSLCLCARPHMTMCDRLLLPCMQITM